MNYNYLIALFNWKRNSTPKGNRTIICIKLVLTLIGIIITSVFLWKIYEVPVYHTNFRVNHNTDSIDISIKIVRDFDLRNHISKDTTSSDWKYGKHTGYLQVDGYAYSYNTDSIKLKKYSNMSKSMEHNLRNMLDHHLQDSGAYRFIDKVKNIVYIQTSGTRRQLFRFWNFVQNDTFLYNKACTLEYKDNTLLQHYRIDYSRINPNMPHGMFMVEDVCTSGIKDKRTLFKQLYFSSELDKPHFFMTAEDYSKIIEEFHFEGLDAKNIHKLDIDYKGAAEFGLLFPKPDSMTISSIHYYTLEKINQIFKDGLRYQVRFPELGNMQEIRIFFATMVLAGLLGIFFNLLYRFCRPWFIGLWQTKSDNIISLTIFVSIILFVIIAYFIYISQPVYNV